MFLTVASLFVARASASSSEISCGTRFSDTAGDSANYSVSNCIFINLAQTSSSVNGGAICVSISSAYALSVSYTSFSNCSSANYGGGLYFSGGYLIINNTCATSCSGTADGQFFYSSISSHASINSISYCKCAVGTSTTRDGVAIYGGVGDITRINSTNNHISTYGAATYCTSSTADVILFANVINCSGSGSVVDFNAVTQLAALSYSNIINNSAGSGNSVILNTYPLGVTFCVMKGNSGYLLKSLGSIMYVITCWIDHSGTISSGAVNTAGCNSITTQTFDLGNCICATKSNGFTFNQKGKYNSQYFITTMILLFE